MSEPDEYEYWEGEDYADEESFCAEGYEEDGECSPWLRLGVEYCEFMCPFNLIRSLYDATTCAICGTSIKRGDILCSKHAKEEWEDRL